MPVIRLQLSRNWFNKVKAIAINKDQDVAEFVLGVLAAACPPPEWTSQAGDEPVVRAALQVCKTLRETAQELTVALKSLKPETKGRRRRNNPQQIRMRIRLRNALKERGLTQTYLAEALGVTASSVSAVLTGSRGLPPAWRATISKVLGDECLSE